VPVLQEGALPLAHAHAEDLIMAVKSARAACIHSPLIDFVLRRFWFQRSVHIRLRLDPYTSAL